MIKEVDKETVAKFTTQDKCRYFVFDPPDTIQVFFPNGPARIKVTKIAVLELTCSGQQELSINCLLNGAIIGEFRQVTGWETLPMETGCGSEKSV